jgi:hypothetical protein
MKFFQDMFQSPKGIIGRSNGRTQNPEYRSQNNDDGLPLWHLRSLRAVEPFSALVLSSFSPLVLQSFGPAVLSPEGIMKRC